MARGKRLKVVLSLAGGCQGHPGAGATEPPRSWPASRSDRWLASCLPPWRDPLPLQEHVHNHGSWRGFWALVTQTLAVKSRLPFALCTQLSAGRSSTHGWPLSAPPHPSQAKPQKPNPTALQIHSLRVSSPSEVFFHAALTCPPLHPSPAAGGFRRLSFEAFGFQISALAATFCRPGGERAGAGGTSGHAAELLRHADHSGEGKRQPHAWAERCKQRACGKQSSSGRKKNTSSPAAGCSGASSRALGSFWPLNQRGFTADLHLSHLLLPLQLRSSKR